MIQQVIILLVGFIFLVKGADWFVEGHVHLFRQAGRERRRRRIRLARHDRRGLRHPALRRSLGGDVHVLHVRTPAGSAARRLFLGAALWAGNRRPQAASRADLRHPDEHGTRPRGPVGHYFPRRTAQRGSMGRSGLHHCGLHRRNTDYPPQGLTRRASSRRRR